MRFEDVYKQYHRDVYYFLLSICGNPELAEELTQETFYRALMNIHKFKGECQLKSWLCQIGRNAYLSWAKKQKHLAVKELEPEKFHSAGKEKGPAEESPEMQYIKKEQALSIYKVLHLLEEPYKEVFILRTLGELSFREIGEIFGRGEGWTRVNYHRAKLKIQKIVKEGP